MLQSPIALTNVNSIELDGPAYVQAFSSIADHQNTLTTLQQSRLILLDVPGGDFGELFDVLQSVRLASRAGHQSHAGLLECWKWSINSRISHWKLLIDCFRKYEPLDSHFPSPHRVRCCPVSVCLRVVRGPYSACEELQIENRLVSS